MSNVTIDGVEYAPVRPVGGEVRLVIGQRGWVWVGYYRHENEVVTLTGARTIRRWGTTAGLGELVAGPLGGIPAARPPRIGASRRGGRPRRARRRVRGAAGGP